MPRLCLVKDCPSLTSGTEKQVLHRFPSSDPSRLKLWLDKLDLRNEMSATSVLCSLHFRDEDYVKVGDGKRLQLNAIPLEFKTNGQKLLNLTNASCKLEETDIKGRRQIKPEVDTTDEIKGFDDFISGTGSADDHETWRDNWIVYKQPDGICFYRLTRDENFTNVTISFKILVNKDMQVFLYSQENEAESSELNWILGSAKLELWSQFYNLMDYYQNEPDIKKKSNSYFLIKQAIETLYKIDDSQLVNELIYPITLQLSLAANKFDPLSGEISIIEKVYVKDEPIYFDEYESPHGTAEAASWELSTATDFTPTKRHKPKKRKIQESDEMETSKVSKPKKLKKAEGKRKPKQEDEDQIFNCEHCGLLFKTKLQLRNHFYNRHDGPVYCDVCGAKLVSRKSLLGHMVRHRENNRVKCPQCDDLMLPESLRRHIKVRHEGYKPFPCSICGKFFSSRTLMREHELIHMDKETGLMTLSNKGMQQCTKCGQRFGRGGNFLRYHIAKCDGTLVEKRRAYKYPCVDCGKKFASKVTCAVHMTEAHKRHIDNIEKFCFECKKEVDEEPFAHAKRHNCAFKCHQCGTRFVSQKKLEKHMKNHKSDEERPFSCSLCSAAFKTKNHLSSHNTLLHTKDEDKQFVCSICNKRFAFQYLLTSHSTVHSDVKRFGCNFCDMKFKKLSRMKDHCKREHGEENAYPCQDCNVKLKTLNDLKSHQQEEHGKSFNVQKYHYGA